MSKSIVLTKSKEIEMLNAIQERLGILSSHETLSECIKYTYERICGETEESTADIVDNYKETIRGLRKELRTITNKILKSEDDGEITKLMRKMDRINKVVNITKNIAEADGNFNDIMFDVVSKGKLLVEREKAKMANDRNVIMRDKVMHEINMDMVRAGAIVEGD